MKQKVAETAELEVQHTSCDESTRKKFCPFFPQPGTYPYYCRLHPIMRGTIISNRPTKR